MKIMVISDTHSDTIYLNQVLNIFYEKEYSKLYHLGDIGIDSIRLLNSLYKTIKAVKGNNDFTLKEAKFKCSDYIEYDYAFNKLIVLTHGHYINQYTYNKEYDIFLYGHIHRSKIEKYNNKIIACPGSISCPRDGIHSYIEINEKEMKIINIKNNKVIDKVEI